MGKQTTEFLLQYNGINNIDWINFDMATYSKYSERVSMFKNNEIGVNEIYGLEQVKEHLEEVKQFKSKFDGNHTSFKGSFRIIKVVKEIVYEEL